MIRNAYAAFYVFAYAVMMGMARSMYPLPPEPEPQTVHVTVRLDGRELAKACHRASEAVRAVR